MSSVAQPAYVATAIVIALPTLGNLVLRATPFRRAGMLALAFCAFALAVSRRNVSSQRAFAYLFGSVWSVLCATFPLRVAGLMLGGPGTGRW